MAMLYISNLVVNIVVIVILLASSADSKTVVPSRDVLSTSGNLLKLSENVTDTSLTTTKTEARETRWSYYYVAAWIWHFPLWFMIYFVWYLVFCTVRSIYNHQINPDDYLRKRRSADDWNLNQFTQNVLNTIENFPNKMSRSY